MKILDLSAGNRAVWFDKNHPLTTYVDKRSCVGPSIVADTTALPPEVGTEYDLIVFDPPHTNLGPNSDMSKAYGHLTMAQIRDLIQKTAASSSSLTVGALMALKCNDHDIKLTSVFQLMPQWEPLFRTTTRINPPRPGKEKPRSTTYWAMLRRIDTCIKHGQR